VIITKEASDYQARSSVSHDRANRFTPIQLTVEPIVLPVNY